MKCRVDSAGYLLTLKQSQGERYRDRYRCPVSVLRVTFCHRGCQAMVEGDGFCQVDLLQCNLLCGSSNARSQVCGSSNARSQVCGSSNARS